MCGGINLPKRYWHANKGGGNSDGDGDGDGNGDGEGDTLSPGRNAVSDRQPHHDGNCQPAEGSRHQQHQQASGIEHQESGHQAFGSLPATISSTSINANFFTDQNWPTKLTLPTQLQPQSQQPQTQPKERRQQRLKNYY
ncbi:GH21653 [Drosophila grimshawi]|uniref:GH21653 n=1 Tax=Drosophila grimshawi TaxID=7222 RepID=B4J5R1_DROGR|nr:GH21653 [Drosophila grimshawi]